MSATITVSGSHMTRDGEMIADKADNITSDINALADAMRSLGGCWEGPAWEAFQNSVAISIEDMKDVCNFFSLYIEELNDAAKVYRRCETQNRDRMRRIRV